MGSPSQSTEAVSSQSIACSGDRKSSRPVYKFKQYGLWKKYTELNPDHNLVYTIGASDYTKDWFYAQVQVNSLPNDPPLLQTRMIGRDNAIARHGIHGPTHKAERITSSQANTITGVNREPFRQPREMSEEGTSHKRSQGNQIYGQNHRIKSLAIITEGPNEGGGIQLLRRNYNHARTQAMDQNTMQQKLNTDKPNPRLEWEPINNLHLSRVIELSLESD
ncbi:hypothetical protein Sjap_018835 [Stephania japonica]|uniref:Uncharacterized protein n=1 Tax=Stephania japonica TaxID=461633 RepID=A0AAP0I8U9_9MAGN